MPDASVPSELIKYVLHLAVCYATKFYVEINARPRNKCFFAGYSWLHLCLFRIYVWCTLQALRAWCKLFGDT